MGDIINVVRTRGMRSLFVLLLCLCTLLQVEGVTRTSLDVGWKFTSNAVPNSCSASSPASITASFPKSLIGKQCVGLQASSAQTQQACAAQCCAMGSQCQAWQFCSSSKCNTQNPICWLGAYSQCYNNADWVGAARTASFTPNVGTCSLDECKNTTDDSNWRNVNVPHDYVVEGVPDPAGDFSHGSLPKSQAWYRKHFTIPASARGKTVWIDFDGIYRNSMAFLNNQYLGSHTSGYTSFRYFLPQNQINWGQDNVVAVYVDATQSEGWWYEGGGIYRHVWLNIADPLHVAPWGVYVPSFVTGAITDSGKGQVTTSVQVRPQTTVVNDNGNLVDFVLTTAVLQGTVTLSQAFSRVTLNAFSNITVTQNIVINGIINLWSPNSPSLYTVITKVYPSVPASTAIDVIINTLNPIDVITTPIGFRKVVFDPLQGMFLNDRPFKINGVCNHQDFAGVGVAVPQRIDLWRVQKMKEMGANGWRMTHHPPNAELLDMIDQLGMVVIDENRNFADWGPYYQDWTDMILRDRNHPSIIMWSVCNEVGCMQGDPKGATVGAAFKNIAYALDATRPFTAAMNNEWGAGLSTVLDVQGINYHYEQYNTYHNSHLSQPMYGSEVASCMGARGVYITNTTAALDDVYDTDYCVRTWTASAASPWIFGGFVWTGFDYKGEPLPWDKYPAVGSNFGILDAAGFEKDTFYYYQSAWTSEKVIRLVPQNWDIWTPGQSVQVFCYSNAAYVELFLNDKSVSRQALSFNQASNNINARGGWYVAYAPGTLKCVSYDKNLNIVATQSVSNTNAPSKLVLSADTPTKITSDGADVVLLRVSVQDNSGRIVPSANNLVTFSVSGPATVLGVGNGHPSDLSPDKSNSRNAFNGLARVIIQSTTTGGAITVTASSPGLASSSISLLSSNL